jgi:hypothetical protein
MEMSTSPFGPLTVEAAHDYDSAAQVNRGTWYVSTPYRREAWTVPLVLRTIFPQELPLLVSAGGFDLIDRFGQLSRDAVRPSQSASGMPVPTPDLNSTFSRMYLDSSVKNEMIGRVTSQPVVDCDEGWPPSHSGCVGGVSTGQGNCIYFRWVRVPTAHLLVQSMPRSNPFRI